jgi:hypothetical protein
MLTKIGLLKLPNNFYSFNIIPFCFVSGGGISVFMGLIIILQRACRKSPLIHQDLTKIDFVATRIAQIYENSPLSFSLFIQNHP